MIDGVMSLNWSYMDSPSSAIERALDILYAAPAGAM
jgi:hypothetical protein